EGGAQTPRPQRADEGDAAPEDPDAACCQKPPEDQVLAVAESPDRAVAGRVLRIAIGERDAAGGEEAPHALMARPAVHVAAVILAGEGPERLAPDPGTLAQAGVEKLLPRRGMECSRIGHDSVEIAAHRPPPLQPGVHMCVIRHHPEGPSLLDR